MLKPDISGAEIAEEQLRKAIRERNTLMPRCGMAHAREWIASSPPLYQLETALPAKTTAPGPYFCATPARPRVMQDIQAG